MYYQSSECYYLFRAITLRVPRRDRHSWATNADPNKNKFNDIPATTSKVIETFIQLEAEQQLKKKVVAIMHDSRINVDR